MKKYIMERGSGKTSKMIEYADLTNGVVLVANDNAKKYAQMRANDMGMSDTVKIVTVAEIANNDKFRGMDIVKRDNVYVDEVDAVLAELLPMCKITACTLSENG